MRGRIEFSRDEIDRIRELLSQKAVAKRQRQKAIRAENREIGFYISDFTGFTCPFGPDDLTALIDDGRIRVR